MEWKGVTTVNEFENRISVFYEANNGDRQDIVTIIVLDELEYEQLKNPEGPSLLELKELGRANNKIYVYDEPHDIALMDTTDIAQFRKLEKAVPEVMKTFELINQISNKKTNR